MKKPLMKFNDFIWPNNPDNICISGKRIVTETVLTENKTAIGTSGCRKNVVEGSGAFIGPEAFHSFSKLEEQFRKGEGILIIPGGVPVSAYFEELELIGKPEEAVVRYRFRFKAKEEYIGISENTSKRKLKAKAGENLWEYAQRYKVNIESLTDANTHIAFINQLEEGETVILP